MNLTHCPNCNIPLETKSDLKSITGLCNKCGFTDGKNYMKIDCMYAFVSVDSEDDNEGIIAFDGPQGPMPMVAADIARVESLKPIAKIFAKSGVKVRLLKFSVREEVEVFG